MEQYRIKGFNYCHYELSDTVISNGLGDTITAKNLQGFIKSVEANHGYYLARYEASYGGGYDSSINNPYTNARPLSKKSTACSYSSMNYVTGTLWNFITLANAATVCRNMYKENSSIGVESDLVNSYAWDTAIVYIQAMGNSNYANANNKTTGNSTGLMNTGKTNDVVCNIFDIASNISEWTTEYSADIIDREAGPCTFRSGGNYASSRDGNKASYSSSTIGYRVLLY